MEDFDQVNQKATKKAEPAEVLDVVKQFIAYFEEVDRSEKNGHSSSSSKRI